MKKYIFKAFLIILALAMALSSVGTTLVVAAINDGDEVIYLSSNEGQKLLTDSNTGFGDLTYNQNLNKNGKITYNKPNTTGDSYTATESDNGLVAHAEANLYYNIEGQGFTAFESWIGIDSVTGNGDGVASVIFEFYLDDALIYTASEQTLTSAAEYVSINISGGKTFRIHIDPNGVNNCDHAVLVEAAFLKQSAEGKTTVTSITPQFMNMEYAQPYVFPSTASVTLSDGTTQECAVSWDTSSFSATTPGEQLLNGTIRLGDNMLNPNGVHASLSVTVGEKDENILYLSDLTVQDESYDWASSWLDAAVENKTWQLKIEDVYTNMVKGVSANTYAYLTYEIPTGATNFEAYVGTTAAASGKTAYSIRLVRYL